MYSIVANNVNDALEKGLALLTYSGVTDKSRNGPVLVVPKPVCITYTDPRACVLRSATRDANPVFHIMESLWMLHGDNDIEFPTFFNGTYGQYSDDGVTMWDAYGWRWRDFFGWDQLVGIINELKENPTSRRCVLSMWNAMPDDSCYNREDELEHDFHVATHGGKAVPCNTHAYFLVRDGALDMTVCNRSNDAVFGCFGANAVHFSFLLEYVAAKIGVRVGQYHQFTNNLHLYTNKFNPEWLAKVREESAKASEIITVPHPAMGAETFDADLDLFMVWARQCVAGDEEAFNTTPRCDGEFFTDFASPMFLGWLARKHGDHTASAEYLSWMTPCDWKQACIEWVERRKK